MPLRMSPVVGLAGMALLLAGLACSQPAECQPVDLGNPSAGQTMQWIDGGGLVYVPGGPFGMGQDEVEPSDHRPAHTVTVDPFWIYQAEVTNRMYHACEQLGACTEPLQSPWYADPKYENAPVSGVTWDQAKAYCTWLGVRLPTEAEWELAARGTDARTYPWGEDKPTCDLLNFLDCLEPSVPDEVQKYPQGLSPYKVADLAGNVAEWVSDWYGEDYYAVSPANNPKGPVEGEARVVRGSSFMSPSEGTRIVLRGSQDPIQGDSTVGFRCVVDPGAQRAAPVCSVPSYVPQWLPSFTARPSPAGKATNLGFYCSDGPYRVRGIVKFDFDIYEQPPSRWSPAEPDVQVTLLEQQPDRVEVYGDAIQPGQPVSLEFCFPAELPEPMDLTCPLFYQYDPATARCEYNMGHGGEECFVEGIVVDGYGCLFPPQDGQCPPGFYSGSYNGSPVCVPTGGPLCLNPDRPPAVCPPGLEFKEGTICCEAPPAVAPVCPQGYTLDAQQAKCVPEPRDWCTGISGVAPSCEPTPTKNCSSFGDATSCQAAGCEWVFSAAGLPFCR